MATAEDFVNRISQVDGIDGCLLVKQDGLVLGKTFSDAEMYAELMIDAGPKAIAVMESLGFSYCRHLCFNCGDNRHFYLFPINKYLLGVVQRADCDISQMLDQVYRLISRVSSSET